MVTANDIRQELIKKEPGVDDAIREVLMPLFLEGEGTTTIEVGWSHLNDRNMTNKDIYWFMYMLSIRGFKVDCEYGWDREEAILIVSIPFGNK